MAPEPEPLVALRDVSLRRGGVAILDRVEFTLGPGLFALVGANGSGKSTLLRALAGLIMPARGSIMIAGHDLWRDGVAARRALGYMPESPEFFPTLAPHELLGLVASVRGVSPEPGRERFIHWVGAPALDLRIAMLSAGQRRKLALSLALIGDPRVLLLDEPAAGVPEGERHDILAAVSALPKDVTVLLIEHDMDLVFSYADRISVLVNGALFVEGAPDEVARDPRVKAVYLGEEAHV